MIEDLLPDDISGTNKHLPKEVIYNDAVYTERSIADFTGNQTQR